MIQAYLFVNLDTDKSQENILDKIEDIEEVKESYRVYGTYDLVLFLEAEDTSALKDVTLRSIRQLEFVSSTMTMISLESYP